MAILDAKEQAALDLLTALPPEKRRTVLYKLAQDVGDAWRQNCDFAEERLREAAAKQGKIWDRMSEDERLELVSDLQHEARA